MAVKMVYGANVDGRHRVIAGVNSLAEFARITGISAYSAKVYGSETGNDKEVTVGRAFPGVPFISADYGHSLFIEYGPVEGRERLRVETRLDAKKVEDWETR
jgi:hypothetical protein